MLQFTLIKEKGNDFEKSCLELWNPKEVLQIRKRNNLTIYYDYSDKICSIRVFIKEYENLVHCSTKNSNKVIFLSNLFRYF